MAPSPGEAGCCFDRFCLTDPFPEKLSAGYPAARSAKAGGRYTIQERILPFGKIGLDPLLQIILGADGRVLPLRPEDLDIFIGLAEKRQAVARPLIFMGQRISHPMEVRRQLVVAPAHQHIADIAGDHLLPRLNAGPLLAFAVFTGTNLQAALAGALEQQRQAVKIGVRAGPPHPLLRLLGCIVMQHAQGALIGVTLRIVRGGEKRFRKTEL